jgi:hypothetical protein
MINQSILISNNNPDTGGCGAGHSNIIIIEILSSIPLVASKSHLIGDL